MNLYNPDGIFTGGYPLEEREAFLQRWVEGYDRKFPGNTRPGHLKRKTARVMWRRHVVKMLERDRKMFAELVA